MAENNLNKPWSTNQSYRAPIPTSEQPVDLIEDGKMTTQLFIYSVLQQTTISLPLIPDSLSEVYSPNIINKQAFGSLHPVYFYAGGSEKTLSFSLDIHEDIHGIGGNLSTFLEKLNKMSYPKVVAGVIEGPETYIQLGRQFAGRGHIAVDFTYKKPFSRGRYKMASVSITFTFHELFDNLSTSVIKTNEELKLADTYGQDLLVQVGNGDSIVDLYQTQVVEDYFIGQYDYIKEKMAQLWSTSLTANNIENLEYQYRKDDDYQLIVGGTKVDPESENFFGQLAEWYLNPPLDEGQAEDYQEFLYQAGYSYSEQDSVHYASVYGGYIDAISPFVIDLMRLLRHYYVVLQMLGSMSYTDAVTNFRDIRDNLVELSTYYSNPPARYVEAFKERYKRYPEDNERLGIWQPEFAYTLEEFIIMTKDERKLFEQTIGGFLRYGRGGKRLKSYENGLISKLNTFIDNYETFSGVGR